MKVKEKPKTIISWSSGKDSAFALHQIRKEDNLYVAGLLTTLNGENDRISIHGVRKELLEKQMEALQLQAEMVKLPMPCDNEIYRQEMGRVVARLKAEGVEHIVFGDLFLEDIRQYRLDQMRGTGIEPLFPLWQLDTGRLARDMVDEGLSAIVTCVDQRVLNAEFVGRPYNHEFLDDLPDGVDPCGENGEFHTVALAGPMFSRAINVAVGERVVHGDFVFADVVPL